MNETTSTPEVQNVLGFYGKALVETPVDATIGTPVTFTGVGRISACETREPYLSGNPIVSTYSVSIEHLDSVEIFGSEETVPVSPAVQKALDEAAKDREDAARERRAARRYFTFATALWVLAMATTFIPLILA